MREPPIRVLLIEDDEDDYLLTQKVLCDNKRTKFDVSWARSYEEALTELENPYDACLVDFRLGAESGLALIAQATAEGFLGPMILLTGVGDHTVDVEAMKSGAADYVVKDQITPELIERVVRHAIERKAADVALRRSEEQLRQSQKLEAIGSLAGGLAHDFNNLLSVILSYSELLAVELKEGDPMRADLIDINEAGVRAADLTRQLLAFSRQQIFRPVIVDFNKVFTQMERMLRRVIGEDIELISLVEPELLEVMGDASQMEQIMMNLVVNARDAMPKGGRLTIETLTVHLNAEDDAVAYAGMSPGPHVMLKVTDTGVGMDKATLARVFEPFFTTKNIGKGTGLGLSTVFGIVKQSSGAIWAASEPGKGAVFSVCFPALGPSALPKPQPVPLLAAEVITLRGWETVLLVEDDERVRVLARTILRKYGYHVLEAQSGGDALIVSEQHPGTIELLLTDVVMPRISGPQLAQRLVSIRPELKVLYMSGYAGGVNLQFALHGSGATFLQKPITPEVLARRVREALLTPRQPALPA